MLLTIKCKGRINVRFEKTRGSKKIDVNIALMKIKGKRVEWDNANYNYDKFFDLDDYNLLRRNILKYLVEIFHLHISENQICKKNYIALEFELNMSIAN